MVTAAISAFPRRETIKVSIRPREKVMRFCRIIGREMGENVKLVNPAYETAKSLKALLTEKNLLNTIGIDGREPTYDY